MSSKNIYYFIIGFFFWLKTFYLLEYLETLDSTSLKSFFPVVRKPPIFYVKEEQPKEL